MLLCAQLEGRFANATVRAQRSRVVDLSMSRAIHEHGAIRGILVKGVGEGLVE